MAVYDWLVVLQMYSEVSRTKHLPPTLSSHNLASVSILMSYVLARDKLNNYVTA